MAEHSSRRGLSLRLSSLTRFFLPLVATLVLLAGCGEGNCNCSPAVTEYISAPNTRPITGLDHELLNAANAYRPGQILGLAPYNASDGQNVCWQCSMATSIRFPQRMGRLL